MGPFLSDSTLKAMRICVDIQAAVSQRAGIGRYTRELVTHLGPLLADHETLSLFYFDFRRRGLDFPCPGAQPHPLRWLPGRYVQQAWKRLRCPPFNWLAGSADLYHFPNFTIPPLTRGRAVVTIHDMSFIRHPEFAEQKNLAYLNAAIHRTARQAAAIITDSAFSKREIEECLGVDPGNVFAIHLGIAPNCVRPAPEQIQADLAQLGLTRPYLLTVGTVEPRKNLPFLIEVFESLHRFTGDLVIAGMPGWKYEPILERLRRSPVAERIRYLQFVPDTLLPSLYAGATLYLTTSFYEGFGFPPLEAMACGTAVVSSAGGSLAEVLGEAAVVLPDFSRDSWTGAITTLLEDPEARHRLAAGGPAQAARYTWPRTARETLDVYRRVLA